MRTHGGGATCENFPARGANVHAPRRALGVAVAGVIKKTGGRMCKKRVKKNSVFVRFVVWLAWRCLRPECKECDEKNTCGYYNIMKKKEH